MVEQAGRYYVTPFERYFGVTQGDPLSPTIFNIVVDEVIRNWVEVVAREETEPEVFERAFQRLALLFYEYARILAPPRTARLQEYLEVMTGMFAWVGLKTKMEKTVVKT